MTLQNLALLLSSLIAGEGFVLHIDTFVKICYIMASRMIVHFIIVYIYYTNSIYVRIL